MSKKIQSREYWIDWLKFVACMMITNSHCKDIYPLSFLAIGGGYGNAIFFVLQGYLLVHIKSNFVKWYKDRLLRLLPAILSVFILDFSVNQIWASYEFNSFMCCFKLVLNKYWFCSALLIYYVFYYLVLGIKEKDRDHLLHNVKAALISWFGGYIIYYLIMVQKESFFCELGGFSLFKVYFYFGVMLIGAYLRIQKDKIVVFLNDKKNEIIVTFFGIGCVFIWAVEYACIMLWNKMLLAQMLIHVGVFGFVIVFVSRCMSKATCFKRNYLVNLISSATLEIYLFQSSFEQIKNIGSFPIGLFMFWLLAISGGIAVHFFIIIIQKLIYVVGEKIN